MKKLSIAVALTALTGAAFAQQGIQVVSVTGTGTVASGSQASGLSQGMALTENSTVTVAKGGSVTIKFPSGCVATVTEGAAFVATEANCQALLAKAQATGGGAGAGGSGVGTGTLIVAGVLGGTIIHNETKGNGGNKGVSTPAPISPR